MLINNFKEQANTLITDFQKEILTFRTSRPTTALVEDINVESYGALTPLKHLAGISIKLPNVIIIEIWDDNLIMPIKKALETSSLGIMPSVEGKQMKLFLPLLSKERKEELIRLMRFKKEEYRVKLRELREKTIEEIEQKHKEKEVSEDERFRLKEEIQKVVEETNKSLDSKEKQKTQEILES